MTIDLSWKSINQSIMQSIIACKCAHTHTHTHLWKSHLWDAIKSSTGNNQFNWIINDMIFIFVPDKVSQSLDER